MVSKERHLDIDYRRDQGDFMALAQRIEQENSQAVETEHGAEIELLTEGLNILYALASHYAWCLNSPHIAYLSKVNQLLFSTIHKNQIALYTSLKLTRIGLYGPARAMLRHVYESLLIAKFCSVSHDTRVYERWKEGDVVYFTNGVLKKIKHPEVEAFVEFWELMSNYSHATIYAQQVELNVKTVPDEVPLNLVYLRTLLECQYHLLCAHFITPSMQYYTKRYRKEVDPVPVLKERMRRLLTESRLSLLDRPKEIIRNYRTGWEVGA